MSEHKNIHEAINAVMEEVGYVKKARTQGLNYSFAGEAALISALRPSMVENGIYVSVSRVIKIERENYTTAKGTAMVNTIIHAEVKFTHVKSDTFVTVESVGEGSDAGDKSANKAMTGLYKYALRQTFCIETGDDPDKHKSEERSAPNTSDKGKVAPPKPEAVKNTSTEHQELVKAFVSSFNAVPKERKGEAMAIKGDSTDDEIRKATEHNLKLMEGAK